MSSVIASATVPPRSVNWPFVDPFSSEPLRDAIFGQAYLEAYARELAQSSQSSLSYPARSIYDRLREDDQLLQEAHRSIREASRGQETLSPDAERVAEARAGRPVREPERRSDAALVGLLQGLRDHGSAAQPIVAWLEEWLAKDDITPAGLLRRENRRQAANQVSVGNCITTLR